MRTGTRDRWRSVRSAREPIDSRKHDIENQQIEGLAPCATQAPDSISLAFHTETALLEQLAEHGTELPVVVYNKDFHVCITVTTGSGSCQPTCVMRGGLLWDFRSFPRATKWPGLAMSHFFTNH
jgi:hypothetical protein